VRAPRASLAPAWLSWTFYLTAGMTSYTVPMTKSSQFVKTTISVPSEVYARATRRAKELGTSRSAFFADAVEKELDAATTSPDVIERINAVVDAVADDAKEFVREATRRLLAKDDDTKW
jgi:metal-responsive CopG/Arc/MetJ family transcriptional regulator